MNNKWAKWHLPTMSLGDGQMYSCTPTLFSQSNSLVLVDPSTVHLTLRLCLDPREDYAIQSFIAYLHTLLTVCISVPLLFASM